MLEYLALFEFIVATLMGLTALCAFLWAAEAGLFRDVEAAKHRVLEVEEESRDG